MKNLDYPSSTKEKQSAIKLPLLVYFSISIGVALQISGSNWDIVWHGIKNVESFFTPPHSVIYSGVALTIGSVIFGTLQIAIISKRQQKQIRSIGSVLFTQLSLPLALKLALLGSILQVTAGPFDFWWHTKFGFDGLLSPPHSVLATGMLMAALGGLIGVHYSLNNNNKNNNNSTRSILLSLFLLLIRAVAFGVFLMVVVGMVLLFTLPFSKGQHYDFNPNPIAAIIAASILIPFLMGLCLFIASKISHSFYSRNPFILTSIIAVVMLIQSTTTITSNSYFAKLFPYYLLNLLPAMAADIVLLKYSRKENKEERIPLWSQISSTSTRSKSNNLVNNSVKRCILASITISLFFNTLFFPWTIDVYGGYFKPPNTIRTEEFFIYLLIPLIIPIVVPVSIIASLLGVYLGSRLLNDRVLKIIS